MTYELKVMKNQSVKIVKRNVSAASELLTKVASVGSHKGWSKAIRSWVDDFRRTERESLRAFDSLFKDDLLPGAELHNERISSTSLREND